MPNFVPRECLGINAILFDGLNFEEVINFIGFQYVKGYDRAALSKYIHVQYGENTGDYLTLNEGYYILKFDEAQMFEVMHKKLFDRLYVPSYIQLHELGTEVFGFTDDEFRTIQRNAEGAKIPSASFDLSEDGCTISFCFAEQLIAYGEFSPQRALVNILDPTRLYKFGGFVSSSGMIIGQISKGE